MTVFNRLQHLETTFTTRSSSCLTVSKKLLVARCLTSSCKEATSNERIPISSKKLTMYLPTSNIVIILQHCHCLHNMQHRIHSMIIVNIICFIVTTLSLICPPHHVQQCRCDIFTLSKNDTPGLSKTH